MVRGGKPFSVCIYIKKEKVLYLYLPKHKIFAYENVFANRRTHSSKTTQFNKKTHPSKRAQSTKTTVVVNDIVNDNNTKPPDQRVVTLRNCSGFMHF